MSTHEASKITGIKDQAVGAIKETIGNVIGNDKMQVEGKVQKEHGKTEFECAKVAKEAETHEVHDTHHTNQPSAQGKIEGDSVSSLSATKDQTMGAMKEKMGTMTNNPNMELKGKAQQIHGKNEAEFVKAQKEGLHEPKHYEHGRNETDKMDHAQGTNEDHSASSLSAMKDQTLGSMKEKMGSMTNNPDMELKGKAQQMHGKNEAEFAKAQKQGLQEPEHYTHGSKTTQTAEGSVEGQKVSSLSALKDQAVGSVKESFGNATGNMNTQIAGKAQQVHGRNEAEFAKAQKEGRIEPAHYEHGTKDTQSAQGEVIGDQPSKVSGYKDQAAGTVKESFGSMTGNQKMEIEGKAQKFHGANQCATADAQNPTNA